MISCTIDRTLMEQEHQIRQNDSLQKLYSRHTKGLYEIGLLKKTILDETEKMRTIKKTKIQEIEGLQIYLSKMDQLKQRAENVVGFCKDYAARQQYYVQAIETFKQNDITSFGNSLNKDINKKRVIVSPDGIHFQDERRKLLLFKLAAEGNHCFLFDATIQCDVEVDAYGVFRYKSEPLLLSWLIFNEISPVVLCTWILQKSWYDLLPCKTIWYDISAHEEILWGFDAESYFQHFEILKTAGIVTCSSRKWKKYTALRKDTLLLSDDEIEKIAIAIEWYFGGKKLSEQRKEYALLP